MRVIVIEHQHDLCHLLETLLGRWGHEVTTASSVNQVWVALFGNRRPDLFVLDWTMPDLDAVALCRTVKDEDYAETAYILMVTEEGRRDDVVAGIDAGVDDYMLAPFDAREFKTRVRTAQRILELNQQLNTSQQDATTGLWRREAIMDILRGELNRCRREQRPLSIAMGQLDSDSDGHDSRRQLRSAARRARQMVRSYDSVGYFDACRFLIILPGCDGASARQVCDRIRLGIDERLNEEPGDGVPCRSTIAVVSLPGGEQADIERVLRALKTELGPSSHVNQAISGNS